MTPTMKIKEKKDGRVRIINMSDYDEKLHEVFNEAPSKDEREELKEALDAKGVKYAKNASTEKLKELLEAEAESEEEAE